LRKLEVNAQGLDLLTPVAGRSYLLRSQDSEAAALPSLLVATLASTRGIDMPELSHVFILGMPEGKIDGYLHAAGRTGRFGKPGKVITVVERKEERAGEDKKTVTDEEKKMKSMFSQMGIKPAKIDHFD
jgi:superfamily II DNA/RNA helicase